MNPEALVVIDLQHGMFQSPLIGPVWRGEELRDKVRELLSGARTVGVPIIHVQHAGRAGHPLEEGTEGWELHRDVAPGDGEIVVVKRTPDAFRETDLHRILQERAIRSIAIAGIQTEFCVDTTCRQAFSLGYEVTLAQDAHSTWNSVGLEAGQIVEHHNRLLSEWFVTLQPASAIEFHRRSGSRTRDPT